MWKQAIDIEFSKEIYLGWNLTLTFLCKMFMSFVFLQGAAEIDSIDSVYTQQRVRSQIHVDFW